MLLSHSHYGNAINKRRSFCCISRIILLMDSSGLAALDSIWPGDEHSERTQGLRQVFADIKGKGAPMCIDR